jgi:catechol 2,3-dioxygenase-like lactoylglutathione lyase family enzyme
MAGSWPEGVYAITLFVEDLEATRRFYHKVFGLEPVFEDDSSAAFRFGAVIVNLLTATEAPDLITPAHVATHDAGARMLLTIQVADVDAVCADLRARGVELLNGPIDQPWGVRTACFSDPGGHIWEIAT